jgi:HSP20 family protein
MSRLSREMDRLLSGTQSVSRSGVFPTLNLYDDGESVIVRAEVPGIDPKDLEINATVNSLTIKGERKRTEAEGKASFHRRERGHGTFSRSINLPQEVDPNKVQASYKLGVLEVMLPKAEETKPRKIEIMS